jgi:hypothetical protein
MKNIFQLVRSKAFHYSNLIQAQRIQTIGAVIDSTSLVAGSIGQYRMMNNDTLRAAEIIQVTDIEKSGGEWSCLTVQLLQDYPNPFN